MGESEIIKNLAIILLIAVYPKFGVKMSLPMENTLLQLRNQQTFPIKPLLVSVPREIISQ